MTRLTVGDRIAPFEVTDLRDRVVRAPASPRLVHLQFRRFAGCPVCDLHLRAFVRRHGEIEAAGIQEVVLFHSSREALLPYTSDLPFAVVADPARQLYTLFGVEAGPRALADPRAWPTILAAVTRALVRFFSGHPAPPTSPEGGRLGLPADLLIGPDGWVLAARYGNHAADHWTVDDLLTLARRPPR